MLSLATNSQGDLLVGGSCQTDAGLAGISKLSKDTGALVTSWNPGIFYKKVTAIAVDANDNLYLAGNFTQAGGQNRNHIAKVSALGTGALDLTWNPAPVNTAGSVGIYSIVLDSRGNVLVGGNFTSIGGQDRSNIARLSTQDAGNADAGWTANTREGSINTLVANNDGNVYIGGFFSTIVGTERHSFAAIGADGSVRSALDTIIPGGIVNAIAKQPNGGMILAGFFSGAGNLVRSNILRTLSDGSVDPNWSASTDAPNRLGIEAIAVGSDNAVYLGGEFSKVNGQAKSGVAKLTASGALDPSWGTASDVGGIAYYGVETLALTADGSVYIGGDFSTVGNQPRALLAKISNQGAVDPNWNPSQGTASSPYGVTAIAVDADGTLYAASYSLKFGQPVVKISGQGNGAIDQNWNPSLAWVDLPFSLLLDGKGYLYVGGSGIARISTKDGSVDPNWRPQMMGQLSFKDARQGQNVPQIYSLALDGNGNLYAGGMFSIVQYGVQTPTGYSITDQHPRPYLAKMSATGAAEIDPVWNPTPDDAVYSMVLDTGGRIHVGGAFSRIGTQAHRGFATLPSAPTSKARSTIRARLWAFQSMPAPTSKKYIQRQ